MKAVDHVGTVDALPAAQVGSSNFFKEETIIANMTDLEVKVANAQAKVDKCKATIERHEKGMAKKVAVLVKLGIDHNDLEVAFATAHAARDYVHMNAVQDVTGKQSDIKGATRKLRDAEKVLANWQARLNIEVEKERFLSEQAPAVIIEFLNKWKEQAREWYIRSHVRYIELNVLYKAEKQAAEDRYRAAHPNGRTWGREYDAFMKGEEELKQLSMSVAMLGAEVAVMASYRREEERLAWLERMLEESRRAKMYDLIIRINEVTGTITDASRLRISAKGNLDGIIVGEVGKAKIETIGVGGYNIVCFHYRTLVHKLKEDK